MTYPRALPGQPIRIAAEAWNACLVAAETVQTQRLGRGAAAIGGEIAPGIVLLRNDSGAAVSRFDVLGIGGPLILPATDLNAFRAQIAISGVVPTAAHAGRFAVLQEPIPAGGMGRALVQGVTPILLDVQAASDLAADVVAGVTASLKSGTTGAARILWADAGTGARHALIALGGAGGGGAGGGPARATISTITQAGHGFAVGTVIRNEYGTWVKSLADTPAHAEVGGIVVAITATTFDVATAGEIDIPVPTIYPVLYLSGSSAGTLTSTPSPLIVPVLMPTAFNRSIILRAGRQIPSAATAGWVMVTDAQGRAVLSRDVRCGVGQGAVGATPGTLIVVLNDGDWLAVSGSAVNLFDRSVSTTAPMISLDLNAIPSPTVAKAVSLKEFTICAGGTQKKMLALASDPY